MTPMANLHLSIAQKFGCQMGSFGTSTGTFHVAAGATCNFISTLDGCSFGNGTAFTGAGTNRLSGGGAFTLDGTIYVQNVEFTAGQLAGTHVLSGSNGFAGSFTWIGGNMSIPGSTTIASNATLSIVSATCMTCLPTP